MPAVIVQRAQLGIFKRAPTLMFFSLSIQDQAA